MQAFGVLGRSLKDLWEELFLVIGLSLLWWLAVILLVGGPPATVALTTIGYRLGREQRVNLDFARETFKENFWISWRLGLFAAAGAIVIAGNIYFYLQQSGSWLQVLTFVFLYLALALLTVLLYAFPFVQAMTPATALGALRNAAIIAFANPLFSLILLLGMGVLTAVAIALPILAVLLLPGLLGIISGRALANRLDAAEIRRSQQE